MGASRHRRARGAVAALLTAIAAALAGCSAGGAGLGPPSAVRTDLPLATARAGRPLDEDAARGALLGVADLPKGWSAVLAPAGRSAAATRPEGCARLLTVMTASAHRSHVAITYTSPKAGRSLEETITSVQDDAASLLRPLPALLASCRSFTQPDAPGGGATFAVSALPFPRLGDDTFAVRFTATTRGVTVVADTVYVAIGHNAVSFVLGGTGPSPAVDLEAMVRTGLARLAA